MNKVKTYKQKNKLKINTLIGFKDKINKAFKD